VNLFDFVSRIFNVGQCIDTNTRTCSCVSAHTHTCIKLEINHFKKKDFSKSNYLCQRGLYVYCICNSTVGVDGVLCLDQVM